LVEKRNYEAIKEILSFPILEPLAPLILLLSWTKCSSFDEAEALLTHLIPLEVWLVLIICK
jgi:hypothetical protein